MNKTNLKQKILVTGGLGYIGSHTTVELMQQGYDVVIIDNLSNSKLEMLDGIENITGTRPAFYKIDICDRKELAAFFNFGDGKDISAVIHFAAFKNVGESVQSPLKYYYNNIVSTLNLVNTMYAYGIGSLVYSSSCSVYGQPDHIPITETTPLKPALSPYGNTKRICEEIISSILGINSISLRYFNPIGAHPTALIGEYPLAFSDNIMPALTQTASGKRDKFCIYGRYNTPDGSCIRDYIDIMDLAKAHTAALISLTGNCNKSSYKVFNIGTGRGYSVFEIINAFEKVTGKKLNCEITARRPGDVGHVYADVSLAFKELKWKAEKGIEDMIKTAWEWEKRINKNTHLSLLVQL